MILSFEITKEQKEALLSFYPGGIKQFVEKTISDTANKIIIERDLFDTDKELNEYHDRRSLNGEKCNKRRKCTQVTKDKISKSLRATSKRQGWKGIPLLPETIEKLKGRIVSKETRDLISKRTKGKKRTEEQRKNLSNGHRGMKYKKHAKAGLN